MKLTSQISLNLEAGEKGLESLSAFMVKLPVFAGPFDRLLYLIDEGEINILEISLYEITLAYLNYLKLWERLNLSAASEFLLLASFLLEAKARSLLPAEETFEFKEEGEVEEIEKSLLKHLSLYKIFKAASQSLKERKELFEKVYPRYPLEEREEEREIFLVDLTLRDLIQAFAKVWEAAAAREQTQEIEDESFTLSDKIKEILSRLKREPKGIPFEFLFTRGLKIEIVVTFLALLELIRQRAIRVVQERTFGPILIKPWKEKS